MLQRRALTEKQKLAVLKTLKDAWMAHPYERLGQLLANTLHTKSLYYVEDLDLQDMLKQGIGEQ
jgi:hypothetical protein